MRDGTNTAFAALRRLSASRICALNFDCARNDALLVRSNDPEIRVERGSSRGWVSA